MDQNKRWMVQRRCLISKEPRRWHMVGWAQTREEAERLYRRMHIYIQCHKMRLLAPSRRIARYCRDAWYFHGVAQQLDEITVERRRLGALAQRACLWV